VGAPAALHAAAEAVIDLAHPQPLRGVGKLGTNLLVAHYVARTDDHDVAPLTEVSLLLTQVSFSLTEVSDQGRN
jgi:hypothetical protein